MYTRNTEKSWKNYGTPTKKSQKNHRKITENSAENSQEAHRKNTEKSQKNLTSGEVRLVGEDALELLEADRAAAIPVHLFKDFEGRIKHCQFRTALPTRQR